ncbi:hypothetical protein D3C72_941210 [compost metagenome]
MAAQRHGGADHVRVGAKAVGQLERAQRVHAFRRGAHVLAHEPAVAGLAKCGRQLHDFKVVRTADDVFLDASRALAADAIVCRIEAVIGRSQVQGAVHVLHANGQHAVVVAGGEAGLRGVADGVIGAERIADAGLEAAQAGGLIQHHVVQAHRVGAAERRAHVGGVVADRERVDRTEVLRRQVRLTTEFQTAPGIAVQAHGGLTTEQAAVLRRLAVHGTEAAFQGEHGAQAVAQIFRAAQAETRTAADTLNAAKTALLGPIELHLLVADTRVDQAVQRYGVGGLRGAGRACQQRNGQ